MAVALAALGAGCGADSIPPPAALSISKQPPFEGVVLTDWSSDGYAKADADRTLERVAGLGADTVGVLVTGYCQSIDATEVMRLPQSPSDEAVTHAIEEAHRLGMRVMLKPHVDLVENGVHWRGQIGEGFDDAKFRAWFASYGELLEHYARMAERLEVEIFSVGTELVALEVRPDLWREVIARVRAVYSGLLTYGANWNPGTTHVGFWDAVDLIGVDPYYPLSEPGVRPTIEELQMAWHDRGVIAELAMVAERYSKLVLINEIGYQSNALATEVPWGDCNDGTCVAGDLDLQHQADAYEAILLAFREQPWYAGILFWSYLPTLEQGGAGDLGFSPKGKPAEDVMRRYFRD